MMKSILTGSVAALALAASAALAACGSGTTAAPASTPAPASNSQEATAPAPTAPAAPDTMNMRMGATVTVTDHDSGASWDVTLNSARRTAPGPYDDAPPAGQHYIVIDVTYSATVGPVDVNEWDWTARSPDGLVSEVQTVDSPNSLSATTIQTGSKIRGTVVLLSSGSGVIVYSAGMGENASWQFAA